MTRRYDIDFIRVFAFVVLILYHVGMYFVPWGFHIKNSITYPELEYPMLFVNQWRLSLLFVISGMGTYFAFGKRNAWQFVKERFVRLFIPLIFGMLVVVPPQIYFERLDQGQFAGSYLQYWPVEAFTSGLYPDGGGISWHHLWFILYLFIFSLVLAPVFGSLRKKTKNWLSSGLNNILSKGVGLYIFIIPLFLWQFFLAPKYPSTNSLIGDYYNLVNYCTLFFFGFLLLTAGDTFWKTVTRNKGAYLISGILGFALIAVFREVQAPFAGRGMLFAAVKVFNMWSWIMAIIGYAACYFNKPGNGLAYANEAVYPFYILHQTVIVALGYYLKYVNIGFFPKFTIMAAGTFLITWVIYEFGIRRFKWVRPLFGMRPRSGKSR